MQELSGQERAELFAEYAHTNIDRWKHLIGRRVVHRVDGPGIITDLNEKYVWFALEAQPALFGDIEASQYVFEMFRTLLVDMELPTEAEGFEHVRQQFFEELPERRRKAAEEAERAREEERRANEERRRQEVVRKRQQQHVLSFTHSSAFFGPSVSRTSHRSARCSLSSKRSTKGTGSLVRMRHGLRN